MKLKGLSKEKDKKLFIYGFIVCAILFIVINYITSLARYRNTESIELASGNISYNKADLNIIAIYQEKDNSTSEEKEYVSISKIPTAGYKLSNKSYCEVGKQRVEEAEFTLNEKGITIANLQEKGTKCYIYFDSLVKEMLGKLETSKGSKYTIDAMPNPITGVYNADVENPEGKDKLYISPDNYGTSYVFRGNNDDVNNWVNFANHTWRIIRINGDGTLRLIFQCAEPNCTDTTGEKTIALGGTAYKPTQFDDNTYVGYYYGTSKANKGDAGDPTYEEAHSNTTPSNIANAVQTWYNEAGAMKNYTEYLDGNTGWCNDRTVVKNVWSNYDGNGTGQTATGYAPASRLIVKNETYGDFRTKQYPTLKCGVEMPEENQSEETASNDFINFDINDAFLKRDLFTIEGSSLGNAKLPVPAALITSDEIVMAGGFGGTVSTDYWLYTNQYYWTMSPYHYYITDKWAAVFVVRDSGILGGGAVNWTTPGVRPVINLNANIEFSGGNGKSSSPFIVNTSN